MELRNQEEDLKISFDAFKAQVLSDYKIAVTSRECSILGRREVFSGKGKFGIFGDGKELPQLAMNHFFKKGDFRSGYYRDQTLLMAQGLLTVSNIFSALYADLDLDREPMSGGRQMGGHFMTPSRDESGEWLNLMELKNHSGDISPTGSQMPRLLGLAQASKIYRNLKTKNAKNFSNNGNEIAWGTIGNASTSEGMFFETINAAGVLQVPMVISVWDDGYGISVSNKDQTTKQSISEALKGFQRTQSKTGFEILTVKGWDYLALIETYAYASKIARKEHVPVLIHVTELTQPLGHSSSGSHERYKSKARLEWEKEYDCNLKMRTWIIQEGLANETELENLEKKIISEVRTERREAWNAYQAPILKELEKLMNFESSLKSETHNDPKVQLIFSQIEQNQELSFKDLISVGRKINLLLAKYPQANVQEFKNWYQTLYNTLTSKISSKLYTVSKEKLLAFESTPPIYNEDNPLVDGRIIIRDNFDALFKKYDTLLMFGEDVGKIGDVNQGMEGLQKKFGDIRIADTGIREATIAGQGIGLALRGLRPIAEIQYLDYILYCLQILSDDLATMSFRTLGRQIAPLIIRTRGHRLEGIWHSGSPMGGLIHLLRGIHVLTPRNMTQAAGFYNTLLQIDQPAVVIESLNGYRLKEKPPINLGEFTVPLGKIEIICEGTDVTVVSYGSTLRIVEATAKKLLQEGISIEVIDIQSLIPFDLNEEIKESVAKTNRVLIVDEDVPGGASSYILQQLIEKQNIFNLLDVAPKLLSSKAHRPAYGSDGDYFSKPSEDDIFEAVYSIMNESNPQDFPL
ncbi:thiamine pyrophosphate-dependent enzyme [Flavobacteriaceae bacterium]|jgi:2-oxoisovalerate dehydrogenase E1 component|nr:thiamine pyrophosphate-dependent enzyme [Flavobacteriaceae bacterium]MDA9851627.1 thiamine pyrophosphate-dependent enzyme [Flavobacteriaceae bacterium]